MNNIGMVNQYDVLVSCIITEKYVLNRVAACVSLLARHRQLPFLNRIATENEKLISYNDVAQKRS